VTEKRPYRYVDDEKGLEAVVKALDGADRFAVDTESDSMHSYFEKVCLIQLATKKHAFLIDPLALGDGLSALADAFADEKRTKILHGADYDIVCLKRDFGYEIRNVFDTMIAAQFLDREKIGLANLVEDYFGVVLDKRHARTNWARRPLSESEISYSYLDVKFLIDLSDRLRAELKAADRFEETVLEFRRLEEREAANREFDPDGYRRIRGARDLEDRSLAILRELYLMRDRHARRLDRPPFKVVANDTLLRVSKAEPRNRDGLKKIKGVSAYVLRRYGDALLKAVARGIKRGKPPEPKPKRSHGRRLSPRQQRSLERLRDWRKGRAAELEVPTLLILPNHAILEVVKARPKTIEELGRLPTVGEKRARKHGEEILTVLHGRR
jgi:ribonuclease D